MRSSRNDTLFMTTVDEELRRYINSTPRMEFRISDISRSTGISRCLTLDVIMKNKLLTKDQKTKRYLKI